MIQINAFYGMKGNNLQTRHQEPHAEETQTPADSATISGAGKNGVVDEVVDYLGSASGQRALQYCNTALSAFAGASLGVPGLAISLGAGVLKGSAENTVYGLNDTAKCSANIVANVILLAVPAILGMGLASVLAPAVGALAASAVATVASTAISGELFNRYRQFEELPGFRKEG